MDGAAPLNRAHALLRLGYTIITLPLVAETPHGESSITNEESEQKKSFIRKVNDKPSKEESYDFFTMEWAEGESKLIYDIKEDAQDAEEKDDGKDSSASDIEAFWQSRKTHVSRPVYVPYRERLGRALDTLFTPSIVKGDLSDKLGDAEYRNLEEEGIYLGEKPYITKTNLTIIENRFLKQRKRNWFTETGEIYREENPLTKPLSYRVNEELNEKLLCVFVPACSVEQFRSMEERKKHFSEKKGMMKLEVGQIRFTHHPLFSNEHGLVAQLRTEVAKYKERRVLRVSEILSEKLKTLRESLLKLEQKNRGRRNAVSRGSNAVRKELDVSRRQELYRREIQECRRQLRKELEIDRSFFLPILNLWTEIKEERRMSESQATSVHLVIHRKEVKAKEIEEREWEEDLEMEIQEIYREEKEEWERKMLKFKKDLAFYKQQNRLKKEAKKRQINLQSTSTDRLNDQEVIQMAQDQITLSTPLCEKPLKPSEVNTNIIKQKVEESFLKSRRPPGEPILDFELLASAEITPLKLCPSHEKKRRNNVSKAKVWLKIMVNNKLVTQTASVELNEEFYLTFSSSLLMALLSWPHNIIIEIYESFAMKHKLVATIALPPPAVNIVEEAETMLEEVEFSSPKLIDKVEEEQKTRPMRSNKGHVVYAGKLTCKLSWKKNEEGLPLVPSGPSPTNFKNVVHNKFKNEEENEITHPDEKLMLDPNDPRNIESIQQIKSTKSNQPTIEMFDLYGEEEIFCSEEELDTSVRLRVLRLRDKGVTEFQGFKFVPAMESQILRKTLENYERKSQQSDVSFQEQEETECYENNPRKTQAENLVLSVSRKLEQQNAQAKVMPCLQDLVQEEQIPNIGSLGHLLTVLKPKRPLKPERRKRDQVRGIGLTDQKVKLIIHIARGFHIPTRQDMIPVDDGSASTDGDSAKEKLEDIVHPFVEVSFQKNTTRTYTSQGSFPTWNQQLVLPFKAPNNDFTASSLQAVDDNVYLHLYDEVLHDLLEDERQRGRTVHHQIEKHWLGSLKIPFSTIYLNQKIEGTFRMDCPAVMLGYVEDTARNGDSTAENVVPNDLNLGGTHLSIYLTLEPTLSPPRKEKETFVSLEPDEVIKEGKEYIASLEARFPQRYFRTHVLDLFGEFVSLNRYIKPLAPPENLIVEGRTNEVEIVSWYVSLLPSLSNLKNIVGIPKLWANSEQFVTMGIGCTDERAVLLVNYMLYLDYEAFLVIGGGIPEGVTSYVLVKINSGWKIICPSSAYIFDVHQPISPLKSVFMLINDDNIFANNQKYDEPQRMNFNTKLSAEWKPFYSKSFPDPGLPSVQPEFIIYKPVEDSTWQALKKKLKIVLRDAVMKWRPLQRTPWNGHVSKIFQKLIRSFENSKRKGNIPVLDTTNLSTIMSSYKVCGVCIHQEYTTIASIVEAVYSTGVHSNNIPGVEFSLAVEIIPYPGEASSIWVYIASLYKKM